VRIRLASSVVGLAALCAVLVAGRPVDAAEGASIRPAPGAPDPRLMVLTAADLGSGAKVTTQHYYKDADFPSVISYSRELEGGRVGSVQLVYVDSEAEVGTSARTTTGFVNGVRQLLSSKAERTSLAKALAEGAGKDFKVVSVGAPRNLGAGPGSFDVLVALRVPRLIDMLERRTGSAPTCTSRSSVSSGCWTGSSSSGSGGCRSPP